VGSTELEAVLEEARGLDDPTKRIAFLERQLDEAMRRNRALGDEQSSISQSVTAGEDMGATESLLKEVQELRARADAEGGNARELSQCLARIERQVGAIDGETVPSNASNGRIG
jgi:hypothetical protein